MSTRKRKRQLNRRLSQEIKAWKWTMRTIRARKVELVIYPTSPIAGMLARLAARHDVPYRFEPTD
jgi:hypothetical protein